MDKMRLLDNCWFKTIFSIYEGHPGKLSFMGYEFGQFIEWREYEDLDEN